MGGKNKFHIYKGLMILSSWFLSRHPLMKAYFLDKYVVIRKIFASRKFVQIALNDLVGISVQCLASNGSRA